MVESTVEQIQFASIVANELLILLNIVEFLSFGRSTVIPTIREFEDSVYQKWFIQYFSCKKLKTAH